MSNGIGFVLCNAISISKYKITVTSFASAPHWLVKTSIIITP